MITVTSARAWAARGLLAALLALGLLGMAPGAAAGRSQGAGPVELAGRPLPGLLRAGHGLPPGFGRLMGYRPVAARLHGSPWPRLVKPAGSCSSPLGQAPFGFGVVCKAHDFGYDLLRFATRSGKGAGVPAARRLIDGQFDHDLHAHCAATRHGLGRLACDGLAAVYAGAVKLNSWRQDEGTP